MIKNTRTQFDNPQPGEALAVLIELTALLTKELPLEKSLKHVTELTLRLLPGNHSSIRLFDDQRVELVSGARSGKGADTHRPMSFKPGQGIIGWVATHGQLARINDTSRDERFITIKNQGFQVESILAVPMWSAGKVVGVIAVTSQYRDTYSPQHEVLAQLLANCAIPPLDKVRLERLALTDDLTLAFNQRAYFPRLTQELERGRRYGYPVSLLLLDLDHFKRVNDTYGHPCGDWVLRHFADHVRSVARQSDVLVRRGGEEFVVIMPHTDITQAQTAAERMLKAIADTPFQYQQALIAQTVSGGLATLQDDDDAQSLDLRADQALYRAKQNGRNRIDLA